MAETQALAVVVALVCCSIRMQSMLMQCGKFDAVVCFLWLVRFQGVFDSSLLALRLYGWLSRARTGFIFVIHSFGKTTFLLYLRCFEESTSVYSKITS